MTAPLMETGTIEKVLRDRGYGFIMSQEFGKVFFHRRNCRGVDFNALRSGQEVSFYTEIDSKGPRAHNIQLVHRRQTQVTE